MPIHLCEACGTSFPDSQTPADTCPICEDERQFVPASGQSWTTTEKLSATHSNLWKRHEQDLFEIRTQPRFGIGQRAFLIRTPKGNILWDCIALLDPATEEIIRGLGGIDAIAISHPHYYTTMQEWARAFDAPVHLHALDREWVMRPDERLSFWGSDSNTIGDGLTLLRLGGHFPGGTVLHWRDGAEGSGALLSGDIVQVAADQARVSFMWSYPNMLPLAASTVRRIGEMLEPWDFDRIYGAFDRRTVLSGGKQAVRRSVLRYVELIEGEQA